MKWEFKHPSIKRVGLLRSGDVFNLQITKTLSCDDSDGKESACHAGDLSSVPKLGRSTGEGNGNPLQYACLEIPVDRGAWHATLHEVTKSRTQLSDYTFTFSLLCYWQRTRLKATKLSSTIFGKRDFPSKMLLSFISVSAHWLPLPITPSARTYLSISVHSPGYYICLWTYLGPGLLLTKKRIIIVTEFKPFKSIIVISQYCGKPSTSSFEDFVVVSCFFFFFFQLSYIPYSRKQGQGKCPCLENVLCT